MNPEEQIEAMLRGLALLAASFACERGNDGMTLTVADRFLHYMKTGEIREPIQNPNNC